ncbi:hypothetical protein PoB_007183200 [Plakobranchus ocellatus]|uniref:Uncharacterized protein n=1 Tax=Plakobranchus ocellatus TaxID=259542 RepID=A0AAV4DM54_9GAST|nr:hypothetical protein PoB_007183200 [Plakobranchus ocellatus]
MKKADITRGTLTHPRESFRLKNSKAVDIIEEAEGSRIKKKEEKRKLTRQNWIRKNMEGDVLATRRLFLLSLLESVAVSQVTSSCQQTEPTLPGSCYIFVTMKNSTWLSRPARRVNPQPTFCQNRYHFLQTKER